MLLVSEIFGPTIQGEGAEVGRPAIFVRTAGCNQACVWCDTPYTWDWKHYDKTEEAHRMEVGDVADEIIARRPASWQGGVLVLTGGEPLLQAPALADLITELAPLAMTIHVETAGTKLPGPLAFLVDTFNVSLKLEHSGNPLARRRVPEAIEALRDTKRAVWKFVAAEPSDLDEVDELVQSFNLAPVYIMPEGVTHEALQRHALALLPAVLERGWSLTPRYHIEIWGDKRGV